MGSNKRSLEAKQHELCRISVTIHYSLRKKYGYYKIRKKLKDTSFLQDQMWNCRKESSRANQIIDYVSDVSVKRKKSQGHSGIFGSCSITTWI